MDKKTHILFLITSLQYGGAERVVVNLARSFLKLGKFRISIMLLEDAVDYSVPDEIDLIKLHFWPTGMYDKFYSLLSDPFKLKRFVSENGVDIVLSFMQRPNAVNMFSKILGSKHASCVSVRCCQKIHYKTIPLFFKFTGRLFFKFLWRYADKTICNSFVIKDEIISLFKAKPETVEVIYNPLNLEEIERFSKETVDEDWFNQGIPVIINVGNLTRAKDHKKLLRAFAFTAAKYPIRLAIIGDGDLKDALMDETKRLKIYEKVFFMGPRSNPYKYIRNSYVFVLSSIYEGFPNVLLEAMACGCPVIATNCPSGPSEILLPGKDDKRDIIETRYGILVEDQSERDLSKAIEHILNNKNLAEKYAKAGIKRASEFNLSFISRSYEKTLLETLECKR